MHMGHRKASWWQWPVFNPGPLAVRHQSLPLSPLKLVLGVVTLLNALSFQCAFVYFVVRGR